MMSYDKWWYHMINNINMVKIWYDKDDKDDKGDKNYKGDKVDRIEKYYMEYKDEIMYRW